MSADVIMILMSAAVLAANCTTMALTFPCRYSPRVTATVLLLFTAAFYTALFFAGSIVPKDGGLPGLAYLPVMLWLFRGKLFQKVFAYFLQFTLTSFQIALAQALGGVSLTAAVTLCVIFIAYIYCIAKFGRRMFEKIFIQGSNTEWALYASGAIFSFALLAVTQIAPGSAPHIILTLVFILWSFIILCFTIINTHDKARHKYEAEFSRDIISSGRGYYQKMSEMLDTLRVLRHDYKYHLDTISELLNSGNKSDAEKYLSDIKKDLSEKELPGFCSNSVLNALLANYAERCSKLDIKYSFEISMPVAISVPNYEMCIVMGNLLENAVEACTQQGGIGKIELVINTQGAHLAVMVKNNFIGEITQDNGLPASAKKDGGLGLRSVQTVASRYGGELITEWDSATFTAYVLMKM